MYASSSLARFRRFGWTDFVLYTSSGTKFVWHGATNRSTTRFFCSRTTRTAFFPHHTTPRNTFACFDKVSNKHGPGVARRRGGDVDSAARQWPSGGGSRQGRSDRPLAELHRGSPTSRQASRRGRRGRESRRTKAGHTSFLFSEPTLYTPLVSCQHSSEPRKSSPDRISTCSCCVTYPCVQWNGVRHGSISCRLW